jgi:hypothetical protein
MQKALKRGGNRVYFPDFPNHPLNGAAFERAGAFKGREDGIPCRGELSVFEATPHNISQPSGIWDESFYITPDMFGVEKVKVLLYFAGVDSETFYLQK